MQSVKTKSKSKTGKVLKQVGRFVVAFTIFALYTSFSPSDGTIEDPSMSQNSNSQTENIV